MPTIERIAAASCGGRITETVDPRILGRVEAASTGKTDVGHIEMPRHIAQMLRKAKITPPPPGERLAVADVDAKLAAVGFGVADRMSVKQALAEKKLIVSGTPVVLS